MEREHGDIFRHSDASFKPFKKTLSFTRTLGLFLLALILICGFYFLRCNVEGNTAEIREPVVAGSWYPSNPEILVREIRRYIASSKKEKIDGRVVGLIVPHAGYDFSGQVAAHAYRTIEGKRFDSVIVVGPSHRAIFRGASVYDRGGFRTPLGIVPVDAELGKRLKEKDKKIHFFAEAHAREHSLEVQIPFLQVVLNAPKILPIVMEPYWTWDSCQRLATVIASAVKEMEILLVASSDLSHYHDYETARKMDRLLLEHIEKFDPEALYRDLKGGRCEACGAGPIITVMIASKILGANRAKVLKYMNSGDIIDEKQKVVGYGAAVIYKADGGDEKMQNKKKVGIDLGLSEQDKKILHQIVRTVVENKAKGKPVPDFSVDSPLLNEKRGAFVSIHKKGQLRGCIGYIEGRGPLYRTVEEMAEAAAFRDPRFPPVNEKELPELEYEISVLTPLKRCTDISEIEVGKHGLYIKKGWYSGLLLPQVATEQGWDRETFLEHTCLKAGLPPNAWKDKNTEIYIFSADVF